MMDLLIQRGADHRIRDADKRTALDYARSMGAARAADRLSPKA
jgi:hypothetical protein